jgi:3-oxoadipate enol-lactonase
MNSEVDLQDLGAGDPVILLHGCPSTTRHLQPLVERLSVSRRVLVPELPGYGKSAPLKGTYTVAAVTELLERELVARGVTRAAIVGHSAGAYRAFALALSGRLVVTQIVSLAGLAGLDPELQAAFRQFAQVVREGGDLRPIWLGRMAAPGFAEKHPDDAAEVLSWMVAAPPPVVAGELEAFAAAEDLRPRLAELKIPVLLRVGEVDEATPPAFSRAIAERVKFGTLQIVPGCGHALLHEDRAATVNSVALALGA